MVTTCTSALSAPSPMGSGPTGETWWLAATHARAGSATPITPLSNSAACRTQTAVGVPTPARTQEDWTRTSTATPRRNSLSARESEIVLVFPAAAAPAGRGEHHERRRGRL